MNVYLQQCEEYINGELTNRYAELFIRGNNGKIFNKMKTFNQYLTLVFYINSATLNKQTIK
jgi:hypothetical protein